MVEVEKLIERIKLALSDEQPLTGEACVHGWDRAVCVMKECANPYALEPLLEEAAALIASQAGDIERLERDIASRDHAHAVSGGAGTPAPPIPPGWAGDERMTFDAYGALDEVVVFGGAHLERLGPTSVFLNLGRMDGSSIAIWISASRKLSVNWESRDGTGRDPSPPVIDREDSRDEPCPSCPHAEVVPTEPGSFVGDIYFGDPVHSTRGTHRWTGERWERLPDEAAVLAELLAEARAERDTWKATAERMVEEPDAVVNALAELAALKSRHAEVVGALEFYADPKNWWTRNSGGVGYHNTDMSGSMERQGATVGSRQGNLVWPDCGSRAQAALSLIQRKEADHV